MPPRSAQARHWLLPDGVDASARVVLAVRALRAVADGYVAILLPAYLLALGFGVLEVGLLSTATLVGSAIATLGIGMVGHRWAPRRQLLAAASLMCATGIAFASLSTIWPLLFVAFGGTLSPSSGDVSVFLPLEYARLAAASNAQTRTALFARYSLIGALFSAIGALAAGLPEWIAARAGSSLLAVLRAMFIAYGLIGATV